MSEASAQAAVDGPAEGGARKRRGSGLDSMVLPELKQLAGSLGLKGTGAMRKGQLIAAIQSAQGGSSNGSSSTGAPSNGDPSNGAPTDGATSNGGTRRARRNGDDAGRQAAEQPAGGANRGDEIANALHELREHAPQAAREAQPAPAADRPVQADSNGSGQE